MRDRKRSTVPKTRTFQNEIFKITLAIPSLIRTQFVLVAVNSFS